MGISGQRQRAVAYTHLAGHTIINEHGRFALHLMPSGVCSENTVCIIGNGVALDIDKFINEPVSYTHLDVYKRQE